MPILKYWRGKPRKENTKLRDSVNKGLAKIKAEGELDKIRAKWWVLQPKYR